MPMSLYRFLVRIRLHRKNDNTLRRSWRRPLARNRGRVIMQLQAEANVVNDILSIHRDNLGTTKNAVIAWINGIEALNRSCFIHRGLESKEQKAKD